MPTWWGMRRSLLDVLSKKKSLDIWDLRTLTECYAVYISGLRTVFSGNMWSLDHQRRSKVTVAWAFGRRWGLTRCTYAMTAIASKRSPCCVVLSRRGLFSFPFNFEYHQVVLSTHSTKSKFSTCTQVHDDVSTSNCNEIPHANTHPLKPGYPIHWQSPNSRVSPLYIYSGAMEIGPSRASGWDRHVRKHPEISYFYEPWSPKERQTSHLMNDYRIRVELTDKLPGLGENDGLKQLSHTAKSNQANV